MRSARQNGFTLFEISIVLVIISLVLGGILLGNEMLVSAKNRGIIKEIKMYQEAARTFEVKYNELPGDMVDPARLWPAEAWVYSSYAGDGILVWSREGPAAWRQLELAGMIGAHISISCLNSCVATPGTNIPASKVVTNAGWTIGINTSTNKNVLMYGAIDAVHKIATQPVLSPKDTWSIDNKIDDALPKAGKMRSRNVTGTAFECQQSPYVEYNVTRNELVCNFDVELGN